MLFYLTGLKERKLVLESCLRRGRWGLLEMSILLTDDIIEFDERCDRWSPDSIREQLSPAVDIKLPLGQHQDLFLSLLIARCPVSNILRRETPLITNV